MKKYVRNTSSSAFSHQSKGMYFVAKPKNEDHDSCLANSHLAQGGGSEFFQVQEPMKSGEAGLLHIPSHFPEKIPGCPAPSRIPRYRRAYRRAQNYSKSLQRPIEERGLQRIEIVRGNNFSSLPYHHNVTDRAGCSVKEKLFTLTHPTCKQTIQ